MQWTCKINLAFLSDTMGTPQRYLECIRRFGPKFPLAWLKQKAYEFSLLRYNYNEAEVHHYYN